MSQDYWNFLFIGISFALYIVIAVRSRAGSTKEYYTAGGGVSPLCKWYGYSCRLDVSGDLYLNGGNGGD